jgi:EAL domain-containing protein (putative c-di-GMP-specific phosphodiesterase class I)
MNQPRAARYNASGRTPSEAPPTRRDRGTGHAPASKLHALLTDRDVAEIIGRFDHVTRLPNRVQFLEDFDAAGADARCLVLITLADARNFNELLRALGHAYSEDFVREGVDRLRSLLPEGTIVYHVSVLSFAFFAGDTPGETPPPIVERIVEAYKTSVMCNDIPIDAKVGVGVTRVADSRATPSELLRATLAAAQDSRRGHAGWAWYNRHVDQAHQRAFRILTDMPDALADETQFSLDYQPRISLDKGECIGAEALMRWHHPEFGLISPGEFVPLAETTALIAPLTQWVLRNAMLTARRWQDLRKGLRVSVNISPRNLEEPHFVDLLMHDADRMGIDPSMVELEFTEGMIANNPAIVITQLERLRDKGFELAIDDFGSGYSNMSYLGKLPARYLKIDQSFIRTLEAEPKNQVLVRSIIDLAHALDFRVVSEGVETKGAYEMLRSWGCDEAQGYFMSRPLAEPAFREWLRDWTL